MTIVRVGVRDRLRRHARSGSPARAVERRPGTACASGRAPPRRRASTPGRAGAATRIVAPVRARRRSGSRRGAASGTAIFVHDSVPSAASSTSEWSGAQPACSSHTASVPRALAGGERLEPPLALLIACRPRPAAAPRTWSRQRAGGERVAHLLGDHHELDGAEPEPAVGPRGRSPRASRARPARCHCSSVNPRSSSASSRTVVERVARRQELAGGALDRLLVVGEIEVHASLIASAAARAPARRRCS